MMDVVVFIGSKSDYEIVQEALKIFKEFQIPFTLEITSAHRTPQRTVKLIRQWEGKGAKIFIAVAGKAAHLAGVVASHTVRPVIGVPVESADFGGLDALLSTVQMPKGVPVATMALGKTGAANAVLLALAILSLERPLLRKKLRSWRAKIALQVERDSKKIQKSL